MKDCPSCGLSVPKTASRCKDCFHDFEEAPTRANGGPIFLLIATATMALLGSGTLLYVTSYPIEERILVDQETQSVIWTRQYRTGIDTNRVRWTEIAKLEYVVSPNSNEIVAVGNDGGRHVIQESTNALRSEASRYAELMDKPLEQVDNTHGFRKLEDQ